MTRVIRKIEEYPYFGRFYNLSDPDYSVPLDQREACEELVYETECDIQEVSKANNPVLIATFSVFMPFDVGGSVKIRRGMRFESDMNGVIINGEITNVVVSRIGGIVAYVKDYDANEGS